MTKLPEDVEHGRPRQATFGEVAIEEFWIVAKSYFAPVYGTLLVWRRLLRLTRRVDRQALAGKVAPPAETPSLSPAE